MFCSRAAIGVRLTGGSQVGHAGSAELPGAVEPDLALSAETHQQLAHGRAGAFEMELPVGEGDSGQHYSMAAEGGALPGIDQKFPGIGANAVDFANDFVDFTHSIREYLFLVYLKIQI